MHLRRHVLEQKADCIVDRLGIYGMVVVNDKNEFIGDGGDFVEQRCQDQFGGRRLRGLKYGQHTRANVWHHCL